MKRFVSSVILGLLLAVGFSGSEVDEAPAAPGRAVSPANVAVVAAAPAEQGQPREQHAVADPPVADPVVAEEQASEAPAAAVVANPQAAEPVMEAVPARASAPTYRAPHGHYVWRSVPVYGGRYGRQLLGYQPVQAWQPAPQSGPVNGPAQPRTTFGSTYGY